MNLLVCFLQFINIFLNLGPDNEKVNFNKISSEQKSYEKLIWTVNSTAVLFSAFWIICLGQDLLVCIIGEFVGLRLKLSFDEIHNTGGAWDASQVLIVYGSVPVYYLVVGLVAGLLQTKYRLKKDLRKLFFLWLQYLSYSIFGGSFITSYIDRGNMSILWEYLHAHKDFMPITAFAGVAFLAFFGVFRLWRFVNISPSSGIIKAKDRRTSFIVSIQVFPLLLLFLFGFLLYPNPTISSRLFSAMMVWVPVIAGIISSWMRESYISKVPAFRNSDISFLQPLYLALAVLAYVAVLFIS